MKVKESKNQHIWLKKTQF